MFLAITRRSDEFIALGSLGIFIVIIFLKIPLVTLTFQETVILGRSFYQDASFLLMTMTERRVVFLPSLHRLLGSGKKKEYS